MGGRGSWALRRRGLVRMSGGGEMGPFPVPDPSGPTTFTGNITITRSATSAQISSALGRNLSRRDIARMAGAPDGSVVRITARGNTVSVSIDHVKLRTPATISFSQNSSGITYHGVSVFASGKNSQGLASNMVIRGVAHSASKGVSRVEVSAAIGSARSQSTGSLTWAKLGLNKTLTAAERASLPASLRGAKDLNTVMLTRQGVSWWRKNRSTFSGYLDLTRGSKGLTLARRAVKSLGIPIRLKPSRATTGGRWAARRKRLGLS